MSDISEKRLMGENETIKRDNKMGQEKKGIRLKKKNDSKVGVQMQSLYGNKRQT